MSMGIELRTRPAEQVYRDHKATHAGICTTCCSMGKMWTESVLGWTVSSWKWRSPACSQKTTYLTNDWSGTCLCTAIVRQTPSTFCECLEYPGRVRCLVAYIIKILENAASKQDRIAPSMCQRIHCWMGEPASWVPTLHQPPNCWLQQNKIPNRFPWEQKLAATWCRWRQHFLKHPNCIPLQTLHFTGPGAWARGVSNDTNFIFVLKI